MNWDQTRDTVFIALGGGVSLYVSAQIRELVKSVQELNIKVAVILANLNEHAERIKRLEDKA